MMKAKKTFQDLVKNLGDEQYLDFILRTIENPRVQGVKMPGFPNDEIQKQFVGSIKEQALREGFNFFVHIKRHFNSLGVPLDANTRVLDFGCGWGRIARFFFKDILSENFFGVDVDPEMIAFCNAEMGYGNYLRNNPEPPLRFETASFDIIYAYSVFSHLAEPVARKWIEEFARILKPDGVLFATTQSRTFLDYCESLHATKDNLEFAWHKSLSNCFIPIDKAREEYKKGKFLFAPTGGGGVRDKSFYGETIIPKKYIKREYTRYLLLQDFVDDPHKLPQALFVMQNREHSCIPNYINSIRAWIQPFLR